MLQGDMFGSDTVVNERVHKVHDYPETVTFVVRESDRVNLALVDAQEAQDLADLERLRPRNRTQCHPNRMKILQVDSIDKAPCPWLGCKYHLHLDKRRVGLLDRVTVHTSAPWEHTCVLDEVDSMVGENRTGEAAHDSVAQALGEPSEMARKTTLLAVEKIRRGDSLAEFREHAPSDTGVDAHDLHLPDEQVDEDEGDEGEGCGPKVASGINIYDEAACARIGNAMGVSGEWARKALVGAMGQVRKGAEELAEYRDHASGADYGTQVHVRVVG
jgi:hypothetical protein